MPVICPSKSTLTIALILLVCLSLGGCSTSLHGTFVTSTYQPTGHAGASAERLGEVRGESCQTAILYLFPVGAAPATSAAIDDAMQEISGTHYLADVSIDDRRNWQLGYSVACIVVDAVAYGGPDPKP